MEAIQLLTAMPRIAAKTLCGALAGIRPIAAKIVVANQTPNDAVFSLYQRHFSYATYPKQMILTYSSSIRTTMRLSPLKRFAGVRIKGSTFGTTKASVLAPSGPTLFDSKIGKVG